MLVRWTGTDDPMTELAKRNAFALSAGHSFILFLGARILSRQRTQHSQHGNLNQGVPPFRLITHTSVCKGLREGETSRIEREQPVMQISESWRDLFCARIRSGLRAWTHSHTMGCPTFRHENGRADGNAHHVRR